jgi:hypothetical protein
MFKRKSKFALPIRRAGIFYRLKMWVESPGNLESFYDAFLFWALIGLTLGTSLTVIFHFWSVQ